MEQKLSNEEMARVFAMYHGCKSAIKREDGNMSAAMTIGADIIKNIELPDLHEYKVGFFILLTPLSEISDEHAIEGVKAYLPTVIDIEISDFYRGGKSFGFSSKYRYAPRRRFSSKDFGWSSLPAPVYQYLISRGYDLPLFFAPNHPSNGKTAIELGIAIAKTKQDDNTPK